MICPYCSSKYSKVTDKRSSPKGTRRRRECLKCKKRFTTYEKVEKTILYVIKKSKEREEFNKEKLGKGVIKAFEKRPVSENKITQMLEEIENQLRRKGSKEIKSSTIGELIMKKMKKLDNVAYIRFASVYKNFQDLEDFKKQIKEL